MPNANPLPASENLFAIADACLPGGGLGGYALADDIRLIFARGEGSRFYDTRGREYIDYAGGAGALILGHSHPAVVAAAQEAAATGMHMFGAPNEAAVQLAQRLVNDIPCAQKIAYATTGSEATAYAMRLARAFTGREKIMKFEGAYHGNHDYALVSTFSPAAYPRGRADTAGQPAAVRDVVLLAPYNDLQKTSELAKQNAGDLAAIVVEPAQRIVAGAPEFLRGLRALCDELGALLIFDEVVTGFRLCYGGAHAALAITPDLASFGKIVGGGGPLAAVAGRADVIELANPKRKGEKSYTYFNGTLHGNPLAAATTMAMLNELAKPGFYEKLEAASKEFCDNMQAVLEAQGMPAIVARVGSLWQFLFMEKPPQNYADLAAGDQAAMRRLDCEMMKRGNYMLPGVRRFVSAVHTPQDFAQTLQALEDSCKALKAARR